MVFRIYTNKLSSKFKTIYDCESAIFATREEKQKNEIVGRARVAALDVV